MRATRLRCQAEAQGRVVRLTASCVGKRLMGGYATPSDLRAAQSARLVVTKYYFKGQMCVEAGLFLLLPYSALPCHRS